jgi:uncharacterized membrane protein YheB (UPF0754 family)
MNYWLLLLLPLTSASIGWMTIWVLKKMFFHPYEPKKIAGFTFHGIYPKRQQEFAVKLAKLVSAGVLSFENIEQKFSNPDSLNKLMPMIENHIDDFLRNRLGKEMPVIAMFIGDKTIGKLKEAFMKEIELLFPQVMKQYASNMKEGFDLEQTIITKIAGFPAAKLEKKFHQVLSKELSLAAWAGAVIGFMMGCLQVLIIYLIS